MICHKIWSLLHKSKPCKKVKVNLNYQNRKKKQKENELITVDKNNQ